MNEAVASLVGLPQEEQIKAILQMLGEFGQALAILAGNSEAHTVLLGKILGEVQSE
jgi:hypothetical protein